MKRVLLTGAGGFIGSHCLAPLKARGYEVHAVARSLIASRKPGAHVADIGTDVVWHEADLLDGRQVPALLATVRPTHLLHLAWKVTPGEFWTSPLNRRWVDASVQLLAAFGEVSGQRAVMVGSGTEYAPSRHPCVEGRTPLAPVTAYGACKAALSAMVPTLARQHGVPSVAWGRVFHVYGPGEPPDRVVPSVLRALLRGEVVPCSHGEQVRDYQYVHDTADALVALLDSEVTGDVNIASGEPVTVRALLSTIGRALEREHLLAFGARPVRPDEPAMLVADVTRLTQEVGWVNRVSLEDGLAETIAWWRGEDGG